MTPLNLLPVIGTFPNDTTYNTCSAPSMGLLPLMPPIALHQTVVLPIAAKVLVYQLSQEIHNPREED
jgi:hypothetical protein